MSDRLQHRGPDDQGAWIDTEQAVALGHRRLSILDLSPAGHQPMLSTSGRFVLVFNGEIYNHLDLRAQLALPPPDPAATRLPMGHCWRGHSDTETLLAGFDVWGVRQTLERAVGMFAIGLWDRAERALLLARDRLGEKPLYYGLQGGHFLFGSELKALRAHPAFARTIDRQALAQQMRYSCVPGPRSIYVGIHKLPPGTLLRVSLDDVAAQRTLPLPQPFWQLADVVAAGQGARDTWTDRSATDALEALLRRAVGQQMVADVPLGAFLSGGVDSSTVVALMQAQSSRPVRTFTIGFGEASHNEADAAKAVAHHLGTDHTELYVSPKQALDVIPQLAQMYDEPFADVSQIPTALVARMARTHVTVSLSGDGGDELFGGYNRHVGAQAWWPRMAALPVGLRQVLASLLATFQPAQWDALGLGAGRLTGGRLHLDVLGDKVQKLVAALYARSGDDLYEQLVSQWLEKDGLVMGAEAGGRVDPRLVSGGSSVAEGMMVRDTLTYLPDDILVKVDRAAMSASLETRVPMLDHRVVEFAWSLPLNMKIRDGKGKWILRQVLDRHVPRALIDRPKQGFGVPIDSWLRGPLRSWAESLLSEDRLRRDGFLNPARVRAVWADHLAGRRNRQGPLWNVLMFQAWLDHEKAA